MVTGKFSVWAPWTISSGTVAVLVGRTGMLVNVPVPVAVQGVPAAMVLHGSAGSTTETVTGPAVARSSALRRSRAPVEQGVVVEHVVELEEIGRASCRERV